MQIILLLTDLFDSIGGIQTFNRSLVKALSELADKKNGRLRILILNDSFKSDDLIKCIAGGSTEVVIFKKSRFKFLFQSIKYSFSSRLVIFGHVNFVPLVIFFRLLCPALKTLLVVYGIDVWRKLPFLEEIGVKLVDKIVSISEFTKKQMLRLNVINENKFDILPCTLDPAFAINFTEKKRSRKELNLPDGKIILTVSRLDMPFRKKNIDLVIRSLPDVFKQVSDACYVIVGDGPDRKRLEGVVNEIRVFDKVIFAGYVPDYLLPSYYEACNVFVLPSEKEGFGIVFLEAMYFSKPCIGANAGAIPEVIENNVTGLLITPDDVKTLSGYLTRLLTNKNLQEKLGQSGKKKLEEQFSPAVFKSNTSKLVESLLII